MTSPGDANAGHFSNNESARLAIIEGAIGLLADGNFDPSIDEVAARVGVPRGTILRYFDDLGALSAATTAAYFDRYAGLMSIPDIGEGTLAERIKAVASSRIDLYEAVQRVARTVRSFAAATDDGAALLNRVRSTLTDQLRNHFDTELRELSGPQRDDAIMTLSTLISFEAWDHARHDIGLSPAETENTWTIAITEILAR